MVKRYNPHSSIDVSAWIVEDACGSVVLFSDHDAVAAELNKAMELLRKVQCHGYFTEQHNVDAFLAPSRREVSK